MSFPSVGAGDSTASRRRRGSQAPSWGARSRGCCGRTGAGGSGAAFGAAARPRLPRLRALCWLCQSPPGTGMPRGWGQKSPAQRCVAGPRGTCKHRGHGAVRGAVCGDGGDGDGGFGGALAPGIRLCCRALTSGPPGDPAAVWCPGKGCRGRASASARGIRGQRVGHVAALAGRPRRPPGLWLG